MVTMLWRHGARTGFVNPLKIEYPPEFSNSEVHGNGMRMLYKLGKHVKNNIYPNLFTKITPQTHKIYSSSTQRSSVSAISFMLGLMEGLKGPDLTPTGFKSTDEDSIYLPPFKNSQDDGDLGTNHSLPHAAKFL